MTRSALSSVLLMAALAAGCAENPTTAEITAPEEAQFGKTSTDTDPRAIWEYFPSFTDANGPQTSRLTGDGRDSLGAATADGSSIFRGDKCGVHAKIFVGNGGGDGVLDPDMNYDRNTVCEGGKRYLQFNLGTSGTVKAGAFTNAFGIWWFDPGESRVQKMNYRYNNISNCEILRFEDANGLSAVRVTRVDDGTGAKQWTVESLPNNKDGKHLAGCYVYSKGSYVFNGKTYDMPFRAR
ncbi:MAG: hypothetical protein M3P24_07300, partial [Gemmatimonadota bacterium]|nr:hypothetical protein [Gemmatimonadota bacterium]